MFLLSFLKKSFRFDLIDSHFAYPVGVAAALLSVIARRPFAVTLRGDEIRQARYFFRRSLIAWALKRAACVITVSEELRRLALSLGARPDRVKTIPNGVDAHVFFPHDQRACRIRHGMSIDRKAVLCAGELVERKGHHLVVRALASAARQGIDAELWIAGAAGRDGTAYEGVIRRAIADEHLEDRVHFLGFVERERLAELMSAADLFCLPSSLEGWPNVVHEASACGTPVVATAVGGVPEMLPDERYGSIVPPGDQNALDCAVAMALQRTWDRAEISRWGRSRSWDRVAAEVLEQFEAVIFASE